MISNSFDVTSTEHRVISALFQWLEQGQSAWLCTIVKTWGASPRPEGSILAFHPEQGIVGSLSGGCIEEALIRKLAAKSYAEELGEIPFLYEYEISGDDQRRYALPCGGQLTILVECLVPTTEIRQHFSSLLNVLNRRQMIGREVSLVSGAMNLSSPFSNDEGSSARSRVKVSENSVVASFGPEFKMLLLGAGDVSRYVASIAKTVDFAVTICEPRESYLQGFQMDGVDVIQCLPDDLVREKFSDPYCAVLALAHDPRVDDLALMEALKTEVFYIGAMGSTRTTQARYERLASLGCTPDEIAKIHGPIGFDIGSKKPAEIAISIMAQVLSERYKYVNH